MKLLELMGESWHSRLSSFLHTPEMKALGEKLVKSPAMTPRWEQVFTAYKLTPPEKIKVLIMGQDPYPKKGQAMGLAFSSGNGVLPYSLENIFKDLQLCDYDGRMRRNADLTDWAEQGVMLLNSCLTTEIGMPFAHKDWGWDHFVGATLDIINRLPQPYVVLAWGKPAERIIDKHIKPTLDHVILKAAHPANERYSKGSYIGSRHFTKVNEFLDCNNIELIKWI